MSLCCSCLVTVAGVIDVTGCSLSPRVGVVETCTAQCVTIAPCTCSGVDCESRFVL